MIEILPLGRSHKNLPPPRGIQTFTFQYYDWHLCWPSEIAIHKCGRFFNFQFSNFYEYKNPHTKCCLCDGETNIFKKTLFFWRICIQMLPILFFQRICELNHKKLCVSVKNIDIFENINIFFVCFLKWRFRGPPPPKNQKPIQIPKHFESEEQLFLIRFVIASDFPHLLNLRIYGIAQYSFFGNQQNIHFLLLFHVFPQNKKTTTLLLNDPNKGTESDKGTHANDRGTDSTKGTDADGNDSDSDDADDGW